jgi:hypothetical protein
VRRLTRPSLSAGPQRIVTASFVSLPRTASRTVAPKSSLTTPYKLPIFFEMEHVAWLKLRNKLVRRHRRRRLSSSLRRDQRHAAYRDYRFDRKRSHVAYEDHDRWHNHYHFNRTNGFWRGCGLPAASHRRVRRHLLQYPGTLRSFTRWIRSNESER